MNDNAKARRAELCKAIDLALLRGMVIFRPGCQKPIRSGLELLSIEPIEGGYYFSEVTEQEVNKIEK